MKPLINLGPGEALVVLHGCWVRVSAVVSVMVEPVSGRISVSLSFGGIPTNTHPPSTSRPSEETAMEKTAKRRSSGLKRNKEELH